MFCKVCNQEKPVEDFYKNDKHHCKECIKKRVRENRVKNVEYYREYDRQRGRTEERRNARKIYKKRLRIENPEKYDKIYHGIRKKYRKTYPDKVKANGIINDMLRAGKLERPNTCCMCGIKCKPQAHHPDYSKPTEIIWVCTKCHALIHRTIRDKQRKKAQEMSA